VDISAYRRTYFACCKSLGMSDDARHEFNHAQVGKYSTGDFTISDWRIVVAALQKLCGQNVAPGRPHIRGHGHEQGGMCTPAQLEYIVSLAEKVTWRASPEAYVKSRLSPLRKTTWSGQWDSLFRSEAANVITALRRMAGESVKTG
jgi:hypothetical protein